MLSKLNKDQRKLHHKQQLTNNQNQIEPSTTTAFSILQFDNNKSNSYSKFNQIDQILIMTLVNYFIFNLINC
jgi:hypothetical protein